MKLHRIVLLVIILALFSSCKTKKNRNASNAIITSPISSDALNYIERYKHIAIAEMKQHGIPASITLAQGLLESGNGRSRLAVEANNHFGIKCHTSWKGKTILHDDDRKDDCFRVYKTAEESFKAHSEFLKRPRYTFLFELDKNDHQSWARGLKKAGYATNPRYAELLIGLIQRYNLNQYDHKEPGRKKNKRERETFAEVAREIPERNIKERTRSSSEVVRVYEVRLGDTLYSIAKRFGLSVDVIKAMNNLEDSDIKLGQLLVVSK